MLVILPRNKLRIRVFDVTVTIEFLLSLFCKRKEIAYMFLTKSHLSRSRELKTLIFDGDLYSRKCTECVNTKYVFRLHIRSSTSDLVVGWSRKVV